MKIKLCTHRNRIFLDITSNNNWVMIRKIFKKKKKKNVKNPENMRLTCTAIAIVKAYSQANRNTRDAIFGQDMYRKVLFSPIDAQFNR